MKQQRGAAIIVAMLVVALATVVAGNFMVRTDAQWRRLENAATADQARWLLRAGEQWAANVLLDDARRNSVDHAGELWAREVPPVSADGYQLTGRIIEQSGRFNLNGLLRGGKVDAVQLAIFRRLLRNLDLPETHADALVRWLGAAPDNGIPAAASASRVLVNVEELRDLPGMTARHLERLRPYVALLPQAAPVNINSAAPETIAALSDSMTIDQAQLLASQRSQSYFRDMQEVRDVLGGRVTLDQGLASLSSRYFLVIVQARQGRIALESRALYERNGQQFPRLVWRMAG